MIVRIFSIISIYIYIYYSLTILPTTSQYLDFESINSGPLERFNDESIGQDQEDSPSQGSSRQLSSSPSSSVYDTTQNTALGSLNRSQTKKLKTLHIAGFFPMTGTGGWIGGSGCLPAAMMALNDVNARPDLLPGYKLQLSFKDSQCNPGKAARFMYDMIYHPPRKVILVCGCSTVCSIVAESANMWNLIVVGYGASSPALSDRLRFPTFFRTHPSGTIHNPTRIKLFEKYGWSRVAIILETEEVFIETARDLEQKCRLRNITLLTRVSFVRQPSDAMDNLKRADPRIIVGMFYKQQARRVMCEAYKRGLYGEKYVWFLIGWYEDDWWKDVKDLDCTYEQMRLAVEGHLTTEALVRNQDDRRTFSGYTSSEWLSLYHAELAKRANEGKLGPKSQQQQQHQQQQQQQQPINSIIDNRHSFTTNLSTNNNNSLTTTSNLGKKVPTTENFLFRPEGYQEAPLAYDAIWAIALALNRTIRELDEHDLSLEQFNYTDTLHIKDVFLKHLRLTNFLGISGEVAFSDIGDRIAWTQIEQLIDGNYTVIGFFDSKGNQLKLNETKIRWPRGEPPKDRTIIVEIFQYISLRLLITILLITLTSIIISAGLIYFNCKQRDDPIIRVTHPPSNNITLIGCIVCLTSVILFGLDGRFIPKEQFWLICNLRAWFLNVGFSLFYGPMFWKAWQSYVITTRSVPANQRNNNGCFTKVAIFCLIDITILIIWNIFDPMDRTTFKIKEQSSEDMGDLGDLGDDVIVELKIEYCQADLRWYYLIFCYKGLLLMFGLFLAYDTKGVKLRQLKVPKLLVFYNVLVFCAMGGPISLINLMREVPDNHYLFVSAMIILCCNGSLVCIYLSQIRKYLRLRKMLASGAGGINSATGNPPSNSMHDEASSRGDEELLNKLEKENRELIEKIREKDSQTKAMIARIEEARESANKSLEEPKQQVMTATNATMPAPLRGQQQQGSQFSLRGRRGINQD